jgi:hypothetical protein
MQLILLTNSCMLKTCSNKFGNGDGSRYFLSEADFECDENRPWTEGVDRTVTLTGDLKRASHRIVAV